jgi:flagellar hook-length control protein FliK
MKTPAISNLINVTGTLTSDTSAAKQSGTSSDTQFNRMLSRGIEERRKLNEPGKPIAKEGSPAKQATQSTRSPAGTNDAGAGDESNAASIDEEATAPAAETSVGRTKPSAEADAESENDEAALAASSDELLALVANLTQAAAPAVAPAANAAADAATGAPVDDTAPPASIDATATAAVTATVTAALGAKSADLASAVEASADPAQAAGKPGAAAQAILTALRNRAASETATSKEPGAATEFDASLAQAKDNKRAADATAAPAQPLSGKNDPAAATQSGPELHAAKTAVDAQPAAAPIAPINVAPQSPASMQQVQAAAAAAADKLTPRVGSNNWDQALGQKVVWMVAGEQQSASLTLNPPDLGPLQVVLSVSNSQATVNFTAAQPEVRQALENAVPKLREMLGDAGIQLGQANVSAGTPNNQQGGFGERQHASRGTGPKIDGDADTPVRTVRSQTITNGGQGLVDTFA